MTLNNGQITNSAGSSRLATIYASDSFDLDNGTIGAYVTLADGEHPEADGWNSEHFPSPQFDGARRRRIR